MIVTGTDCLIKFKSSDEQESERKSILRAIGTKVTNFFWDDIAKYGLEERVGQTDMAFEIVDALNRNQHIAIEAGVGIGKSFGYLVPAVLYNKRFGKPVIVATSTIALQEQLYSDVNNIFSLLRLPPSEVVLAKGQTHYLCYRRANEFLNMGGVVIPEELRDGIQYGARERKDFSASLPLSIWEKVNIQRFNKKDCSLCKSKCLYYSTRSNLQKTHGIVLCNQDFLTSHLRKIRGNSEGLINGNADLIIVDEAHNLEDKVRNATTEHISQKSILRLIEKAINEMNSANKGFVYNKAEAAQNATHTFFECLEKQVQDQIGNTQKSMKYAERFFFIMTTDSMNLLNKMSGAVEEASNDIQLYSDFGVDDEWMVHRSSFATDELYELSESLVRLIEHLDDNLLWIEKRSNGVELLYCPKNTKQIINQLYFSGTEKIILTSATLTGSTNGNVESQYSYFVNNTGFPVGEHGCLSEPKPSPYPYDQHSMIYYCNDLPHPRNEHEAFVTQGVHRLLDVLSISNGKALILFTSKSDMEEVFAILCKEKLPYKVLIQQSGSSQDRILNEFKNDTNSVLLGTGAYWEGISIEGKSLSNVVIFRLPFPVPDPIIQYKSDIAKDALMDVQVPEMIIKLKQGIGRLIRNFSDTGIICIIDPRLRDNPPERYHDIVWESLPIKNRTSDIVKLKQFYDSLSFDEN